MIDFRSPEDRGNFAKTYLIGGSFIMVVWFGFPFCVRRFVDPHLAFLKMAPMKGAGTALSVFGYVLAVWCVMLFIREGKGTPLPFAHPRQLVIGGPYRFVRNPMVIGTVLFLIGSGLFVGSCGILFYAAALFIVMHFFVLIEEKSLARRFGSLYAAYLRKTPRWWPRF